MESIQGTSEDVHNGKHETCDFCVDVHQTPRKDARPAHFNGAKENRQLGSFHRKDQKLFSDVKESPKERQAQTGWCETPKIKKKDVSLRRRLLISRPLSDSRKSIIASPVETSRDLESHRDDSFDTADISPTGPLTYSTLDFSCRKRRLLFSQAVTSTLETGRNVGHVLDPNPLAEPDLDESIIAGLPAYTQSNDLTPQTGDPFRSPTTAEIQKRVILETPSLTLTPEDSGFSSMGLDKSQDESVDHDGSFQELVLPLSSGSKERRRSRLDRQRRLSTLREGGSQSDDGTRDQWVVQDESDAHASKDEVFLDKTPLGAATLKMQDLSLTPALQIVHAISRRSMRVLHQQTSLEELLRVSEEDGPVRTSLPLSGLIGRKMGLDRVDIITELKMRNLKHILSVIMSLLSVADIYRFGQVSDEWNDVISEDKKALYRRRCHVREMKIALEAGRTAVHVSDADTRLTLSSRSALSSVQAQARTPHTPHTPSQHTERHISTKRMEYLQVAQTLFNDEYLKPCPRCQHPARCHSLRGEGLCSWADCGFRFCMSCLCAFHGSRDCAHLSARRRSRREVLAGSAQSRRNIRRL